MISQLLLGRAMSHYNSETSEQKIFRLVSELVMKESPKLAEALAAG